MLRRLVSFKFALSRKSNVCMILQLPKLAPGIRARIHAYLNGETWNVRVRDDYGAMLSSIPADKFYLRGSPNFAKR